MPYTPPTIQHPRHLENRNSDEERVVGEIGGGDHPFPAVLQQQHPPHLQQQQQQQNPYLHHLHPTSVVGIGGGVGGGFPQQQEHPHAQYPSHNQLHQYTAISSGGGGPPPPPTTTTTSLPSSPVAVTNTNTHNSAAVAAATAVADVDDTLIWDQLNDAQSREVQQHQSRFHAIPLNSRSRSSVVLWSFLQTTTQRTVAATMSAIEAAQEAWNHYPTYTTHSSSNNNNRRGGSNNRNRNRQRRQPNDNTIDAIDREFGLQPQDPDIPMLSETLLSGRRSEDDNDNDDKSEGDDDDDDENGDLFTPLQQRNTPRQQRQRQRQRQRSRSNNNNGNTTNNHFILLSPFRLVPSSPEDGWGTVSNLDLFLSHLYHYYYSRGLLPIICKGIVELIVLLFTLWLSIFLLQSINWSALSKCHDSISCHESFSSYINTNNGSSSNNSLWTIFVHGYIFLFTCYTLFYIWSFYQTIQHGIYSKYIFEEKLGISSLKLQGGSISWDTIVQRLIEVNQQGEYRFLTVMNTSSQQSQPQQPPSSTTTTTSVEGGGGRSTTTTTSSSSPSSSQSSPLDALLIAQRILRKENFLIALFNQNQFNIKVNGTPYFCKTLEWSIYFCVLNFMFNHKYEIRPAFYLDPASLKRRFQVCGIIHGILLPFLVPFMTLHFILRHAYDFKTNHTYMGIRDWSLAAKWTFREFNELPHIFEKRIIPSYDAADEYLKLFGQSEILSALGKLLVFIGGALGGVLLVFAAINDAILLHVELWGGRNLLWYAGLSGVIYSIGKAISPSKDAQPSASRNLFQDMNTALKNVTTHTHYYPDTWKGRGWDSKVRKSFSQLIDTQVKLFLQELAAVVLAPYILCKSFPQNAEQICEFCLLVKAKVSDAGEMCGYATFDFDVYGDETWEGRTLGRSVLPPALRGGQESLAESILRVGNVEDATQLHPKPKAREGKMEKSFFNFQTAHPSWKCAPSGQTLVDRVEEYRQAELAAMTRERELHIEAAARQLETLARLELQQQQQQQEQVPRQRRKSQQQQPGPASVTSTSPSLKTIDETHIPRGVVVPPADAGAGSQSRGSQDKAYTNNLQDDHSGRNVLHGQPTHHLQYQQHQEPPVSVLESATPPPPFAGSSMTQLPGPTSLESRFNASSTSAATTNPIASSSIGADSNWETNTNRDAITRTTNSSLVPELQPPPPSSPMGSNYTNHGNGTMDPPLPSQQQQHDLPPPLEDGARNSLRAGLSTELRHILSMSTSMADPALSVSGSSAVFHEPSSSVRMGQSHHSPHQNSTEMDRTAERQYLWLERFHAHLETQRQQHNEVGQDYRNEHISRSVPSYPQQNYSQHQNNDNVDGDPRGTNNGPMASSMV